MSRSNPNVQIPNPINEFMGWHGNEGYWWLKKADNEDNRDNEEESGLEKVESPFKFGLLDCDSYLIKGKDEEDHYRSNVVEFKPMQKWDKILYLKKNKQPHLEGRWADLKLQIPNTVKIHRLVNCVVVKDGEYLYVQMTLRGNAFYAFGKALETMLRNGQDVRSDMFWMTYTGSKEVKQKKGGPKPVPVFGSHPMSKEENTKIYEMDVKLQEYFQAKRALDNEAELQQKDEAEDAKIAENQELAEARAKDAQEFENEMIGNVIEKNDTTTEATPEVQQSLDVQGDADKALELKKLEKYNAIIEDYDEWNQEEIKADWFIVTKRLKKNKVSKEGIQVVADHWNSYVKATLNVANVEFKMKEGMVVLEGENKDDLPF